MATAETARLIASLELQDKLSKGVKAAQGSLGKFESKWDKVRGKVGKGLAVGGAAAAAFVAVNVKAGLSSLAELETATTQVDGAIKQLGLTGKVTSSQIATWANEIEANVGAAFDDKDIVKATATLIRFGKLAPSNIRPAMQVITDLATKTGSVESAASLLAKALADPAKAAGKLTRSGVILTKQQQDQLKAMTGLSKEESKHYIALKKSDKKAAERYKTAKLAAKQTKAQTFILKELAKVTDGAAEASQGKYQRSLSVLQDVTEDAQRALAEGFLPVIEKVRDILAKGLADPNTLNTIREFGRGIAGGLDSAIEIARSLPWKAIGDGLKLAGSSAKVLFDAFRNMPPEVQATIVALAGLNKLSGGAVSGIVSELGKGLIKGVLGMNAGVVNINAATVNGAGGAGAAAGAAGAGGIGALGRIASLSIVATAAYLTADTLQAAANNNATLKSQGLTDREVTAKKFFEANKTEQETIRKRIGYLPTKADYDSGTAKLNTTLTERVNAVINQTQRTGEDQNATLRQIRDRRQTFSFTNNIAVQFSVRAMSAAWTQQEIRTHFEREHGD